MILWKILINIQLRRVNSHKTSVSVRLQAICDEETHSECWNDYK